MKNTVPWSSVREQLPMPSNLDERVEEQLRNVELRPNGHTLSMLRRRRKRSQTDLAKQLGLTQSQLSRFERRRNHRASTLRKYVEALGGTLNIVAVFPDARVRLKDV